MALSNTCIPRETRRQSKQKGFSLIELMVVVAIISILGMIALPQYQKFAVRAKVTAALSEMAPGKAGLETLLAEGFEYSSLTPADVGLPQQGTQCTRFDVNSFELFCTMKYDSVLGSPTLNLRRDDTGTWTCHTSDIAVPYLPEACRRS